MKKLYVAYGSNMNIEQMAYRCPHADIVCNGTLPEWKLVFRGSLTGAYATIVPRENSSVPVVIWQIASEDEKMLDLYEGYPRFYRKEKIDVETNTGVISAMVYIMNPACTPGIPTRSYIHSIACGYRSNSINLDPLYAAIEYNKIECSN